MWFTTQTAVTAVMLINMSHWSIIRNVNSTTLAILFLALVAAALVYAALYALFGKPSTLQGKKDKQEVISGFQLAAGILLGFVLMASLVGFAGIALGATSGSSNVSRPVAGIIVISTLVVIGLMVQRWAKYVAGWFAYSILNSLMMASSGHLLNNPAVPVKRPLALTMAGLCFVTVLVTQRFTKAYKLHWAEKVALMVWIVGFALAANVERFSIPAVVTGTFPLVLAWWVYRSKSRRRNTHAIHGNESTSYPPTNY
jgi:hypothetical protein